MRGFQQDKSLPYCFEHYHSPHLSHFNFCPASKNYIETFFFCLSHHSLTHFLSFFFIKVIIFPSYSSTTTTTISPMSDRYRPRGPRNQQRGGYQSRSSYIPQRRDNRNRDTLHSFWPKKAGREDNYRPDNDRYQQQENRPASSIPHGESPIIVIWWNGSASTTQRPRDSYASGMKRPLPRDQQASGKDVISI